MASIKNLKGTIIHRHDTAINWQKNAPNFTPKKGELVIFDADIDESGNLTTEGYDVAGVTVRPSKEVRLKIGDGKKNVIELPYVETGGGSNMLKYLSYTITNGEVTITGCDKSIKGSYEIPSFIEEYRVTSIGESAFKECNNLTSVIIPHGVTSIGKGAFNSCENLRSIIIPNSVETIESYAFDGNELMVIYFMGTEDEITINTDNNNEIIYIDGLQNTLDNKQDKLVAGTGITLDNTNKISVTGYSNLVKNTTYASQNKAGLIRVSEEFGSAADTSNGKLKGVVKTDSAYTAASNETLISKGTLEPLLNNKQDTLVSGTNIKTINGQNILGNGNITIEGGSGGPSLPPLYVEISRDKAGYATHTAKEIYEYVQQGGEVFFQGFELCYIYGNEDDDAYAAEFCYTSGEECYLDCYTINKDGSLENYERWFATENWVGEEIAKNQVRAIALNGKKEKEFQGWLEITDMAIFDHLEVSPQAGEESMPTHITIANLDEFNKIHIRNSNNSIPTISIYDDYSGTTTTETLNNRYYYVNTVGDITIDGVDVNPNTRQSDIFVWVTEFYEGDVLKYSIDAYVSEDNYVGVTGTYNTSTKTYNISKNLKKLSNRIVIFARDTNGTCKLVAKYLQKSNIENSIGNESLTQAFDPGYTYVKIASKNPLVEELELNLTDTTPMGATGDWASSFGGVSAALGKRSFSCGTNTVAKGDYSFASGDNSIAYGNDSHAEGYATVAKGQASHSEGSDTQAIGDKSHAEGYITKASGTASHAEGESTKAEGRASHAEGENNIAGVKVFYINAWDASDNTYALDSVEGLEVDDVVSIKWGGSYINFGKITAIDAENLTITTDKFAINDVGDPYTTLGVLFVVDKPTIGLHSFDDGQHVEGTNNVALLWGSHAEGYGNVSADRYAHTEGIGNIAYYAAHAEGYKTAATGKGSHSEGYDTHATGNYSHAEGNNTEATGNQSHAEGNNTHATGDYSHAEGHSTTAEAMYAHAEGYNTHATNYHSHAEGNGTTASGESSHAEGNNTTIGKAITDANGKITYSGGKYAHAEGTSTTASGEASHAEGNKTTAEGDYSHAEGYDTHAISDNSHAEGSGTEAKGTFAHAEGHNTHVWGEASHAEGYDTYATNTYSHAEGNTTHADGEASHAEGYDTHATGNYSHAEGYNTYATSAYSHAEGNTTEAKNTYAHAEGYDTHATGNCSHTEGSKTTATKVCSHAEGNNTHATGNYAHAEGHDTYANGDSSHTEGYNTRAEGNYSHTEGRGTYAKGNYSHAGGRYTFAEYNDQTVIGKFNNNKKDTLLEVGCGVSESQRENCFETGKDKDGNAFICIGETKIMESQLKKLLALIV